MNNILTNLESKNPRVQPHGHADGENKKLDNN